jgi:hypothetical protein
MGNPIHVNTDNSDPKKKLFNAGALSNAAAIEKKMQEVVVETIRNAGADFNTDKPGKGYSLRMKVEAVKDGRATTYAVKIEILRYPPEAAKGGKGEAMVPITVKPGQARLEGASDADLLDAIAQLTMSNVKAAIGPMRIDMTRR